MMTFFYIPQPHYVRLSYCSLSRENCKLCMSMCSQSCADITTKHINTNTLTLMTPPNTTLFCYLRRYMSLVWYTPSKMPNVNYNIPGHWFCAIIIRNKMCYQWKPYDDFICCIQMFPINSLCTTHVLDRNITGTKTNIQHEQYWFKQYLFSCI